MQPHWKFLFATSLVTLAGAVGLGASALPYAHAHENHGAPTTKAAPRAKAALSVGAAFAPDGALWVVGLNREGRLFTQISKNHGKFWEAPRLLDTGSDKISADGENRPKIAFGTQGQVVIAYTQPLAKPYTGAIRMLRSGDGGKNFSPPFTVHQDRQIITHRFESLAFDGNGVLHTVWIDKRDLTATGGGGGKKSAYVGAAIYRNESRDGGASFGADIKLADHSCECCRIALAPTPDGRLAALWRHVFAPNIRDHAFAILGAEPAVVSRASFDEWSLDACPYHGPGLAAAQQDGYHAVWFGERDGRSAVRYGRLAADGTPQGSVLELPDTRAEHADVVTSGKRVAIVWRSFDGTQTRLRAWVSDDDGAHFSLRELAAAKEQNDYPRLLATPQGIWVVWRTEKDIHVVPIVP
jgi:hypothetical protein